MASKKKAAAVEYRDPTAEGQFMWGCHNLLSDDMAACTENTRELYVVARPLYVAWDAHMLQFALATFSQPSDIRREALRYLLVHGDALLQATKKELDKTCRKDHAYTDEVIRDWFCWLYRQFRSWKQDEVRAQGQ
jgi:hypothetical protein